MRSIPDTIAEYGPPDRPSNFQQPSCTQRKRTSSNSLMLNPAKKVALPPPSIADFTPNPHPEVLGRNVRMKFDNEKGQVQWYDGIIISYNSQTRRYGIFFPCD